jgi:uncharacterized protein (DUF1501 family)
MNPWTSPGNSNDIERRRFLQGALGSIGALAVPSLLSSETAAANVSSQAVASQAISAQTAQFPRALVIINLSGGNDAVNTLVGPDLDRYRAARGPLALRPDQLRRVDSHYVHGALVEVQQRYARGEVAFVPSVAVPGASMSHSGATVRWMSGTANDLASDGWLGRSFDGVANNEPFGAIHLGPALPILLQGKVFRGLTLPDVTSEMFGAERRRPRPNGVGGNEPHHDNLRLFAAVERFAIGSNVGALAQRWADTGASAVRAAVTLGPAVDQLPDSTTDGSTRIARRMKLAAALLNLGVGTRVVSIAHGGFDTHMSQLGVHERLLSELDGGIRAFFAALQPARAATTIVAVVTEFGRRVVPNSSGGTDHGGASLAMLIGAPVAGGVKAPLPSLSTLNSDGNQIAGVDGRLLFSDLVIWLGLPSDLGVASRANSLAALD